MWKIGLKRFASEGLGVNLKLDILPLQKNVPIYLPQDAPSLFPPTGEISEMRQISASPAYEVIVVVV